MATLDILTYGFALNTDQGSFGYSTNSLLRVGNHNIPHRHGAVISARLSRARHGYPRRRQSSRGYDHAQQTGEAAPVVEEVTHQPRRSGPTRL